MGAMGLDRARLAADQLERQRGWDRSWAEAQRGLADPEFRSCLELSLRRLDTEAPPPVVSREDFLAQSEPLAE